MRVALQNREAGHESRPEQRRADLADTAAHAFDRAPAENDQRLGITGVQADIAHHTRHREGRPGRHQQTVEIRRGGLDVLQPFGRGAAEVRSVGDQQLADAQLLAGGVVGHIGLVGDQG